MVEGACPLEENDSPERTSLRIFNKFQRTLERKFQDLNWILFKRIKKKIKLIKIRSMTFQKITRVIILTWLLISIRKKVTMKHLLKMQRWHRNRHRRMKKMNTTSRMMLILSALFKILLKMLLPRRKMRIRSRMKERAKALKWISIRKAAKVNQSNVWS